MIVKRAAAYLINNKVIIQAYSLTTVGVLMLNGPIFTSKAEDIKKLGQSIIDGLNESKKAVPHPTSFKKDPNDPFLVAAGVKTWNMLMKLSKNVSIELKEEKIIFVPSRFEGVKWGYKDLDDKKLIFDLNPEHLGKALLEAFELCE